MTLADLRQWMKQLTSTDAIGAAVAAVLTIALVFGVVAPLSLRDRQILNQQQAAARQKQRLNGLVATVRSLKTEAQQTRAQIAASPLRLRPLGALNLRLASLVTLAVDSGLAVEDLKATDAVHARRFMLVPIRIKGRGGYRDCVRFLGRLHGQLPDVGVSSFRLTGSPETAGAGSGFELELRWLALPPGTTDPAADAAAGPAVASLPQ